MVSYRSRKMISNSLISIERITTPNKETISIRIEIKGIDFLLYMLDNQRRVFS